MVTELKSASSSQKDTPLSPQDSPRRRSGKNYRSKTVKQSKTTVDTPPFPLPTENAVEEHDLALEQDRATIERSPVGRPDSESSDVITVNPYMVLVQKKTRALKKRLRRIEATENTIELSAKNLVDPAQLKALERKPEVTAQLNILEELLPSMVRLDTADQEVKKEEYERVSREYEEMAISSFIQLIRLFYTMKELDDGKDYLDKKLSELRNTLDSFRKKLIANAETAEMTNDKQAQKELYRDVRRLTEASMDTTSDLYSTTYKEIYDHLEYFTHTQHEPVGSTTNLPASTSYTPTLEAVQPSASANPSDPEAVCGANSNTVPVTRVITPAQSEPAPLPVEYKPMKDPALQVLSASDARDNSGTKDVPPPLPVALPVHVPIAPMPQPVQLIASRPLSAYQTQRLNYQLSASHPSIPMRAEADSLPNKNNSHTKNERLRPESAHYKLEHEQQFQQDDLDRDRSYHPSGIGRKHESGNGNTLTRRQAKRTGSRGNGSEAKLYERNMNQEYGPKQGQVNGQSQEQGQGQVHNDSLRQAYLQQPCSITWGSLEPVQAVPPPSIPQHPMIKVHQAEPPQEDAKVFERNESGGSGCTTPRQACHRSLEIPEQRQHFNREQDCPDPHKRAGSDGNHQMRLDYTEARLQPPHIPQQPFMPQHFYHHIPHYYYPGYRVPYDLITSDYGPPGIMGGGIRVPAEVAGRTGGFGGGGAGRVSARLLEPIREQDEFSRSG
ncbi:hypothetical protein BGZ65_005948 [Modicella reniformis]|uniref:Uncharacterized protein n=1 Tax=Modicella reniformis TaxID=1440133 RepID=A0A9P6INV7_9FUNG|nr:hypothetical protein BGZ65_005948 [Modicella reniformis]